LSLVAGIAVEPQQPPADVPQQTLCTAIDAMVGFAAAGALVVVVEAAASPQQPESLLVVPQHPCAATTLGMNPPFRSVLGAPAGCWRAAPTLVLALEVSIVVLLVRLIPVLAYMDVASQKRTHHHSGLVALIVLAVC
jgi:hypothetical protein